MLRAALFFLLSELGLFSKEVDGGGGSKGDSMYVGLGLGWGRTGGESVVQKMALGGGAGAKCSAM
jgi:hypothetical protein